MRAVYGTLKTAFTAIDRDHNGVISRKELRDALTTPPLNLGLDAATINAIIEQADVDGNGKIDFSEFSQMFSYGKYQDELRRMRQRASSLDSSSLKSTSIMRAPAAPLIAEALERFWMLLQSNFHDITLAFHFINGSSLRFSRDGSLVVTAPAAAFSDKHTTKTRGLSEQDFELGIGRLELLHRLRQAVALADASTPRDAWTSPSKRLRASNSSASGGLAQHMRSSRPSARGVKVDTHVLDVLIGCPGWVTMQTRCKLLELVCAYTHDQSLQLLQHADRVRKQRQGEDKCTGWPEFTQTIEDVNSTSDGLCTPAQQLSLAGQQAISIFRALDVGASGDLSEAALVCALSKWLAAQDKEQELSCVPPHTAKQERHALEQNAPQQSLARQALPTLASEALPTVPEHVSSPVHSAQGSSPTADAAAEIISNSSSDCAGGPKDTMTCKAWGWLASAPVPAPSQAVVQPRAVWGGKKEGEGLTKQLKALRDKDVLVLQKRLQEIEDAHGEATSRILRAEQREAAVREHEAAVKVQQANADERERRIRMRELALAEHEKGMALLNAEVAHKAHELEETARVLQQRKSAVEHREKLLQQQVAHVQKLQDMVNHTYKQHDMVAQRDHHSAENPPATGTKHSTEYSTGETNQRRRALQSQQQRSAAKSKGIVSSAGLHAGEEKVFFSREKELEALAVLLQSERDRYFAQLQAVERLVHDFDALPNTPGPLLDALRSALYP